MSSEIIAGKTARKTNKAVVDSILAVIRRQMLAFEWQVESHFDPDDLTLSGDSFAQHAAIGRQVHTVMIGPTPLPPEPDDEIDDAPHVVDGTMPT